MQAETTKSRRPSSKSERVRNRSDRACSRPEFGYGSVLRRAREDEEAEASSVSILLSSSWRACSAILRRIFWSSCRRKWDVASMKAVLPTATIHRFCCAASAMTGEPTSAIGDIYLLVPFTARNVQMRATNPFDPFDEKSTDLFMRPSYDEVNG